MSFPRRREPISTQEPNLAIWMDPRLRGEDTTRLEIKQSMRLPCVRYKLVYLAFSCVTLIGSHTYPLYKKTTGAFNEKGFFCFIPKASIFLLFSSLLLITNSSYALPFTIIPKAGVAFPTSITTDSTVTAYYTVFNNTASQRNNNFVKYLPPNVSQVTQGGDYNDTCGTTFNLAAKGQAGDSCTLQLLISGPVYANAVNAAHHLFVCFPGGKSCAGTPNALNVTQTDASPPSPPFPVLPFAYITNDDQGNPSNVENPILCAINTTGDNLVICSNSTAASHSTRSVTINPTKTLVYFGSVLAEQIQSCLIQSDGSLATCVDASPNQTFNYPNGLAFNPAGTRFYATHVAPGLQYCTVNLNTGVIDPCAVTANSFITGYSLGVVINAANTMAYVTDDQGRVIFCEINGTVGSLFNCQVGTTIGGAFGLAIQGSYLYVTNQGSAVLKCGFTPAGGISACNATGSSFSNTRGIAINTAGTVAYVANQTGNSVTYCNIAAGTGELSGCINQGPLPGNPSATTITGIAVS